MAKVFHDEPPRLALTDLLATGLDKSFDRQVLYDERGWIDGYELECRSNRVAHGLISRGVGADVLVGICCRRSADMVVGLLGILKAGAAYVPLDPDYPAERLAFMLKDAAAPILLTQRSLEPELHKFAAKSLLLDGNDFDACGDSRPDVAVDPDSLAYVIYTSGSTGRPKGAMNSHRAIANRLQWMQETFRLTAEDAVLQKTPFGFDVSVWEFFWPLTSGARLVMPKAGGHQDPVYLADVVEQHEITVLHFVPSMLRVFLEQPSIKHRCRSLRAVICSGEVLSVDLQKRFFETFDAELHNLYGPTEAAIDVTHWPCQRDSEESTVPIGWPIANTQIHILDTQLQPVQPGVDGELHIGGVQVGRGYHNRDTLTAERFIDDPFSDVAGSRLYKSGDLARWREDGAIEYRGRMDFQVKIRGQRIELGEIEAALENHPEIRQAALTVQNLQDEDKRLIACYVSKDSSALADDSLRRYLVKTLPAYMIPQFFIHIDDMPVTANGKLDRKRLPAIALQTPTRKMSIADPVERFVADIWAEVLELRGFTTQDRFFEIGGTSLQAAKVVNRLQQELREFIYVISFFDAPTIGEYAAFLRRDYADALQARLKIDVSLPKLAKSSDGDQSQRPLGAGDIQALERAIPETHRDPGSGKVETRNQPAIFVLAPPRSGTTLIRVMLSGHPKLFAAPELQLLCFDTLKDRRQAYSGKFSLWLEGLLRSIMEIFACNLEDARTIMANMEERDLTTKACYAELQSKISPRLLVDKSPSYALDMLTLNKAESDFEGPLYIHLVRHPCGMVNSFQNYHIDQALYLDPTPYRGKQLGELIWYISHQNILEFLGSVPQERQFFIQFEDLVTTPQAVMQDMCSRFGLDYDEGLIQPYKNIETKMVDGLYAESIPMGDTRLLERQQIEPGTANAWQSEFSDKFLGSKTVQLAQELGYSIEDAGQSIDRREQLRRHRAKRMRARRNSQE